MTTILRLSLLNPRLRSTDRAVVAFLSLVLLSLGCRSSAVPEDVEGPTTYLARTKLVVSIDGCHRIGDGRLEKAAVDELADARALLAKAPASGRWFHAKSAVDDAAWTMEELYRADGHAFAEVTYDYEVVFLIDGAEHPLDSLPDTFQGAAPTGKALAAFHVVEGPRPEIEQITFRGRQAFAPDLLETFITGSSTGLFGGGAVYYVDSEVRNAVRGIRNYYISHGFLDAEAELTRVDFSDDQRTCNLVISIEEGPLYRVRQARYDQENLPESSAMLAVTNELGGRAYYPRLPYEARAELIGVLGNAGYPKAEIEVREKRGELSADENWIPVEIVFDVQPGPRVEVSGIEFSGNARTRASTLRRKLAFREGELYTLDAERSSFEELYRSGLFERVRIRPEERAPDRWVVVVEVVENEHREYFVEPGYGSYERLRLRGGFRHRNLFGTGTGFRLEGTLGDRAQRAETGFSRDRIFGSPLDADLSFLYGRREEPSFTSRSVGSNFTLTHDFTRVLRGSIRYGVKHTDVTDIQVLDADVEEALANVNIASISLAADYDSTDNNFVPTRGGVHVASVEQADGALGSEVDFVRVRTNHSRFFALGVDTVLGVSWRGGTIVPIGDTETIPIQERFLNGGENSVRSFQRNLLGPVDDSNEPVGGEGFNVFNVELRQRLIENFQGAAFVDAGNVLLEAGDFGLTDMRYAVGVGLRYLLPIGPVRLDAAFNPDARDGESEFVVHFSVGNAF